MHKPFQSNSMTEKPPAEQPQEQEYQVLARRYRPQTFAEVLGQEAIVTTLKNGIKYNRLAHAYLFCGSRGTGKTTLARILAKALNCSHRNEAGEPCGKCNSCREITSGSSLEVLEIDGASHRGIDDVRQINETVTYAASGGKYKIYIIDEVHMLTKEAFNALLKTLEEPPPKVKFFFATTEPHKVPATILSRCQRFNLNRIPLEKIVEKLTLMATAQNMAIEEEALRLIAHRADGGFRDAESLLDQISAFHEGAITVNSIAEVLGTLPREIFFQLDEAGKSGNLTFAFEISQRIFFEGKDIYHFVEQLIEHFRTLLLLKLAGGGAPFVALSAQDREKSSASAKFYTQEQCLTIIDFLIEAQSKIRFMPSPRIALEALLLKILKIHHRVPIDFLVKRLAELEEAIAKSAPTPTTSMQARAPEEAPKVNLEAPVMKEIWPKAAATPAVASHAETAATTTAAPPAGPAAIVEIEMPQKELEPIEMLEPIIDGPKEVPLSAPPAATMTEDPTPSASDLGKPSAPIERDQNHAEQQKEAKKRQSRYDTILQFAAIELEGSLQKKPMRGL